ncbi:thioredoxin family protein [Halopseudomonas pachastrellae]|nr:thioredoxin family protein [Halopseudomonas pachastrellae]
MKPALPDGLIVVAKADCPTCRLVEPLLVEIAQAGPLTVYAQDSAEYAADLPSSLYDKTLEHSFHLGIEFVPTLIRVENGAEVERTYGWHKEDWRQLTACPSWVRRCR